MQGMIELMRIILAAVLLCSVSGAQSLEETVRARIGAFPGTVTLYAKNLDTGATFGIRESDPVRTASTIKLPILCAVADQVASGKAAWTELLTVRPEDKVSGSGVIGSELSDGVQLQLREIGRA